MPWEKYFWNAKLWADVMGPRAAVSEAEENSQVLQTSGKRERVKGGPEKDWVFVRAVSKYTELVAISDRTAETVAKAIFAKWICRYGVPTPNDVPCMSVCLNFTKFHASHDIVWNMDIVGHEFDAVVGGWLCLDPGWNGEGYCSRHPLLQKRLWGEHRLEAQSGKTDRLCSSGSSPGVIQRILVCAGTSRFIFFDLNFFNAEFLLYPDVVMMCGETFVSI